MAKYTKRVSAGTRIYYFDVRTDSKNQEYITIAELTRDGKKRSCIYLHTEDFAKFTDALNDAISRVETSNVSKS